MAKKKANASRGSVKKKVEIATAPRRPSIRHDLSKRYSFRLSALSNTLTLWSTRTFGRKFGISTVEWRVLTTIAQFGASPARDITANTIMDKGNVSRAVQTLLEKKLIKRRQDKSDSRTQIISLTPAGRRLNKRVSIISINRQKRLASVLSAEERRSLDRILEKLSREAKVMLDEQETS